MFMLALIAKCQHFKLSADTSLQFLHTFSLARNLNSSLISRVQSELKPEKVFLRMSSREKILLLFDVDGTLTKPRQKICGNFENFLLTKVKPVATLGLVGGSDFSKISEQMNGKDVIDKYDYVFCENGLVAYTNGELVGKQSILKYMGEEKLQVFINFCLGYLSQLKLPAKRGNFIEFRTGLINVCPVGRSCSQEERDAFAKYDNKHKVRENFVAAMKENFPEGLSFAMGGQISIDVFPTGWDKTYCLNHVASSNFETIHFFGDKTSPGGNDHEIFADERTIGHSVNSPGDTELQLKQLFSMI